MLVTDEPPDPDVVPAAVPVPRPLDIALRRVTTAANHGVLWLGIAAVGAVAGGRARRAALRGVASLSTASFVSNSLIKPLIKRRRPDPERTALARQIGHKPWTSSFPSGHSASAAAFATGAALEFPATAAVLGPLAAAVAYSRVHVGVHYKSDVVTGAAIGVALAVIGRRLWPVKPWGPAAMFEGDAPALPGGEGLTVVVNEASGSSDGAQETLAKVLPKAHIVVWDAEHQALSDAVPDGARALGVAGGDGTVASVATLALDRDLPLAVFPFGTLNHFAGAIGLQSDDDTVAAVEAGVSGRVDVATINEDLFLNTASIGGYPEMVKRRDQLTHRMGKWPATAYALIGTLRSHTPMDLSINGHRAPVWVVFIGNGIYRPRGLAQAWREDLADRMLDVQYLRADRPLSRTRGVIWSLLGLVESSRIFRTLDVPEVSIVSHSGPLSPAHDGEVSEPVTRVRCAVDDRMLLVYRG